MIEVAIFKETNIGYFQGYIEEFINYGEPKKIHDIKFSTAIPGASCGLIYSAMIIYEKIEVKDE